MKKLDVVLIISTLIFSLLFYQQTPGVNVLVFTIFLISISTWLNPLIIGNKKIILVMLAAFVSACNVVYQNTLLAMIMNGISLITLAGLALNPQCSWLVASLNSFFSLAASILIRAVERIDKAVYSHKNKSSAPKLSTVKIMSVAFPLLVAIGFLLLYASANPKLESIFAFINLKFISWPWLKFTFLSYLLLFGFFYQTQVDQLTIADARASNTLNRQKSKRIGINVLSLKYELKSGWLLFILLNLILLGFHFLDAYYVLIDKGNSNLGHSQYLHQGVNTLIVSIVLAIAVILYYFRGNLNFYKKNSKLKVLVYIWIFQNAILVLSTSFKNLQYIADYGLTYKRIGVYLYLALTLVGLITTFIKTRHLKSNWYLERSNSMACYLVMVLATFFNGDKIITQYNLANTATIDMQYLLDLSDKNLPELKHFAAAHPTIIDTEQKNQLYRKKDQFHEKIKLQNWPSWNYTDYNNHQKLTNHE